MSVNTSVTGAFVVVVVILLTAGLLWGLFSADIDLLNPYTSRAEAYRMQQEADLEARRGEIDLETYRQEQEIRLDFQRRQAEQDLAHQRELHQTELALLRMRETVLTALMGLAVLSAGGGGAFYLFSRGRRAWVEARPPREEELQAALRRLAQKEQKEKELRAAIARLARENERLERRNEALKQQLRLYTWMPAEDLTYDGNGKEHSLVSF